MSSVDVVVVSYNSRDHLRGCVEPLVEASWISVILVDNASADDSPAAIEGLPVTVIAQDFNGGFAQGCNRGWREGAAPYVLFLNPDARIDAEAVERLAAVLEDDKRVGIVGPRILNDDGSLALSLHHFPRVLSTLSEALYLHHLFPERRWSSETVVDESIYGRTADVEWLSGACLLVRREVLERLGGFDESFFMYSEDLELCRATWDCGLAVRYEPSATATHVGGASAPRPSLLPVLVRSRILYTSKNCSPFTAALHRFGFAVESITHALVTKGGWPVRRGYLDAFRVTLGAGAKSMGRPAAHAGKSPAA